MYVVKCDHAPVRYAVMPVTVVDSEGNLITDGGKDFTYIVSSTDSNILSVMPDPVPTGVPGGLTGSLSFGSPGVASINVQVFDAQQKLLGSFGAQFTLTVGDPATVQGGAIAFEGLQEV